MTAFELRLPRKIEADPRRPEVEAALTRDLRPLWEEGRIPVPHLALSDSMRTAILQANGFKQIERGLERIEPFLIREKKGLDELAKKTGQPPAKRISRLLVMTNDGTERFNRACETILFHHGERVLGIRLSLSSAELGQALFGEEKGLKAFLVSDREAATGILLALADSAGAT